MPASSPTDAGQGPAGVCGIPVGQGGNAPLRLRLAAHPPPLAGEALGGPPPGRLPCKGSCRRQPTEGCGALPCQYPSEPPQGSPAGVNARPTMQGKQAAEPGGGRPPHAPVRSQRLRRGRCLHRPADGPGGGCLFRVITVPGRNVGRRFRRRLGSAASQGLRDDASIVPYGCRARPCRGLRDTCGTRPPAGVNARPTMQGKQAAEPGAAGRRIPLSARNAA